MIKNIYRTPDCCEYKAVEEEMLCTSFGVPGLTEETGSFDWVDL